MRYCNSCHRITVGEPLFCNYCGHSYDVKLCPARHVNPRAATICSQCGSHELSTPHPPMPLFGKLLLRSFRILPGVLLLVLSVLFLFELVKQLLQNPIIQGQAICLGLLLAALWWLYMQLPSFVRHGVRKVFRKGTKGGHGGH